MKTVRADLVIATLALLISAGATVSSLYQTHVIADQLSSSVWPYLDIDSTTATGASWQLAVTNDGLGPALIRSAGLSLDGRPIVRYRDGFAVLLKGAKHTTVTGRTAGSIGPASVIRAGESFTVLAVRGPVITGLGDLAKRVVLTLCYCSLQDQCWTVTGERERASVPNCADERGLDF